MKPFLKISIIVLLSYICLWSCVKPQIYPDIPQISYKSFSIKDTVDTLLQNPVKRARLTIYVIDGDGDIGLPDDDTIHKSDLFLTLFYKKNGKFEKVPVVVAPYYRLPYIEVLGQNKTLKADIVVKLDYETVLFHYDTIQYEFYIKDRAFHQSNVITSPELVIKKYYQP